MDDPVVEEEEEWGEKRRGGKRMEKTVSTRLSCMRSQRSLPSFIDAPELCF